MFSQEELNEWYERIDEVFEKLKDKILALVDSDQDDQGKLEALGVIYTEQDPQSIAEEAKNDNINKELDEKDKIKEDTTEVKDDEKNKDDINENEALTKTTKHTLQHNKIVDMMESYGLLTNSNDKNYTQSNKSVLMYLEYGAGRGLLSHYLHERLDEMYNKEESKVRIKLIIAFNLKYRKKVTINFT